MAFTMQGRFTATIVDEQGTEALCSCYALFDPTATLAAIETVFDAWLVALDPVTSGRIVRAQYVLYPQMPSLKADPLPDSRVSETCLLNMQAPMSRRRDAVTIPALNDALLAAHVKPIVDSGALADFVSFIETGGSSLEFSTSDFDAPLTLKDATCSFRLYNNQIRPRTFVLAPG